MKKWMLALAACLTLLLGGCGSKNDPNTVTILNYGKYFEPSLLDQFEEETGITVKYEEYESPEEMYAKYKAGSIRYDVACTSDYIIQKLIQEGETLDIDFNNIPEFSNIDKKYLDYCKNFDPQNRYTLPYFFGTVGILYNTKMVDPAKTDTWNVLWDKEYAGQVIMENSVRDTYMVALKLLGASCNTTDREILDRSLDLLLEQKPQAAVFNILLHTLHAAGELNGGQRSLPVPGGERAGDYVYGVLRRGGHADQLKIELLELGVKGFSHNDLLLPGRAPGQVGAPAYPKRPVI